MKFDITDAVNKTLIGGALGAGFATYIGYLATKNNEKALNKSAVRLFRSLENSADFEKHLRYIEICGLIADLKLLRYNLLKIGTLIGVVLGFASSYFSKK